MPWAGVCKAGGCTLCSYQEGFEKMCGVWGGGERGGGRVACFARAMVRDAYSISVSCVLGCCSTVSSFGIGVSRVGVGGREGGRAREGEGVREGGREGESA